MQRISLSGFVNQANIEETISHDNILNHFVDDALSEFQAFLLTKYARLSI